MTGKLEMNFFVLIAFTCDILWPAKHRVLTMYLSFLLGTESPVISEIRYERELTGSRQ